MKEFAELLLYLSIALAILLFFGPIVVIISIIGQINIGTFHVDLSKTGWLGRVIIAVLGLGVWLSVYIPLILVIERQPTPAIPLVTVPTLPATILPLATETKQAIATSTVFGSPTVTLTINTVVPTNTARVTSTTPTTAIASPCLVIGRGWQWIDPQGNSEYDLLHPSFWLSISAPAFHDLYPGNNFDAPRMLQPISGNFEIIARVKFNPQKNFQGAGILVWQNKDNFLRLERAYGGAGDEKGQSGIRFDTQINGVYSSQRATSELPITDERVELRLRRVSNVFTAFWRRPNEVAWQEVGKINPNPPFASRLEIGVAVVTWGDATEISALFECIWITPIP
jgi:regulation of enolase protein 1 (concanavalin A-like superfamily)